MKIVDYKIVYLWSDDPQDIKHFENHITDLISKGWQPLGGIAFANTDKFEKDGFAQALVKYQDE